MRRNTAIRFSLLFLLGAASLPGCGSGSPTVPLRGQVLHAGKPIPVGKIVFMPDTSKGNNGAQGFAAIEDGKFDTAARSGRGSMPGRIVVKIEGYHPAPTNSDAWLGKPLFAKPYEQALVISPGQGDLTIEIPASYK